MSQGLVGGILIGIGIGLYIPSLPGFLSNLNLYLGLIFIIVGLIILMKSK